MKKLILSLLLVCSILYIHAQDIPGYNVSNYAGISGFHLNPASIADSRYKFDMSLFGSGSSINNNYVGMQRRGLYHFNDPDFQSKYMKEGINSKTISISNQNYVQMPSFMVSITPKIALAFNFRLRHYLNIDNINPELARLAYNGLDVPSLYNLKLENDKFSFNTMAWGEYGIGYAQVINSKGMHFVKIGGQAKLIQGMGAAYFYARDLNYSWKNSDTLSLFQSAFGYGMSDNIELSEKSLKYKFITKPSVGFDVGAVYEFRPNYKKYFYEMDGETNLERKDKNKYLVRVGVSLLDIGRVKFKKSPGSGDFNADIRNWNVKNIDLGKEPVKNFNDTLKRHFAIDSTGDYFTVALPTAFSVQVDYNIYKDFYVNFTSYVSPRFINIESKIHSLNYYRLTPRWDHKWFGVYLPMGFNQYGQWDAGASVRLGPLIVGSSNIGNFLVGNYITGLDGHMALKIPIFYGKPKDKDGDKISNKRDYCPREAGTWETHGCPDRDADGIADKDDKCPDVKGVVALNGCPDKDGDDIADMNDNCPEDAGPVSTNGCPDKDGDGTIDLVDKCIDVAGSKDHFGCPDSDGDSLFDFEDNCITEAGPKENNGCPYGDIDKDGVPDKDDLCPESAGKLANKGCPDTDGDGLFDNEDECPQTAGPVENKGCPVIEKKEKEIVDYAFKSLEFDASSAVILQSSYENLNKLAELLVSKPKWQLRISGHTDNAGDDNANMDLSRRRAIAVKNYLVNKGVEAERIMTEYYGETKPIDTNETPEGRAKNRRVELEIVFE